MSAAGLRERPQSKRMSQRTMRLSPVSASTSTSLQAAPNVQYASGSDPATTDARARPPVVQSKDTKKHCCLLQLVLKGAAQASQCLLECYFSVSISLYGSVNRSVSVSVRTVLVVLVLGHTLRAKCPRRFNEPPSALIEIQAPNSLSGAP